MVPRRLVMPAAVDEQIEVQLPSHGPVLALTWGSLSKRGCNPKIGVPSPALPAWGPGKFDRVAVEPRGQLACWGGDQAPNQTKHLWRMPWRSTSRVVVSPRTRSAAC